MALADLGIELKGESIIAALLGVIDAIQVAALEEGDPIADVDPHFSAKIPKFTQQADGLLVLELIADPRPEPPQ